MFEEEVGKEDMQRFVFLYCHSLQFKLEIFDKFHVFYHLLSKLVRF